MMLLFTCFKLQTIPTVEYTEVDFLHANLLLAFLSRGNSFSTFKL